jgi:ATP synthase F1 gamma subunit
MISSSEAEKKIKTIRAIGDIINAMKAYSGLTVRKTEELVLNIRQYEAHLLRALADIKAHHPGIPLTGPDRGKRILVAFGSSQGMCGAYNEKMADSLAGEVREGDTLFVIGRKLKTTLEARKVNYGIFRDSIVSISGIQDALEETLSMITGEYLKQHYYELTFVFTYVSDKKAYVSVEPILPPDISRVEALEAAGIPPFMHLPPEEVFERALEEFLFISLYRCFLESLRSENWFRLRSLEAAAENIEKRIEQLGSLQNYARQEEITAEMIEILGGGMFYK